MTNPPPMSNGEIAVRMRERSGSVSRGNVASPGVTPMSARKPHLLFACMERHPARATIASALADLADVTFVDDRARLRTIIRSGRFTALVLPVRDASGRSTAQLLARLRERGPALATTVLVSVAEGGGGTADAARGTGELLFWRTHEELGCAMRRYARRWVAEPPTASALALKMRDLPGGPARRCLMRAIRDAHERLTVEELARRLGCSRRTLSRRLRVAGWPPPSEILRWGQLLRAGLDVDETSGSTSDQCGWGRTIAAFRRRLSARGAALVR